VNRLLTAALVLASIFLPNLASAEVDPFPGIAKGEAIPNLSVSSNPGESSADFDARVSGTFSCPVGSASALSVNVSTHVITYYCVKTWESAEVIQAWQNYRNALAAAQAAAEAESRAWNAANPGRQKCVQWGPITSPDGGQSSGGVCANPFPAGSAPSGSSSVSTSPVSESDLDSSSSGGITSSSSVAVLPLDPTPGDSVYRGSGYPYTQVVDGQVGVTGCPVGFQAANGLIVDVGTHRVYTECWPERAWIAYRLGGEAWDLYKASGGSYDPSVEIDRRNKVLLIRARAKAIAEAAALLTPGVERCSAWSGFGESGRECAYAFIVPSGQSVSSSATISNSTSSTISSETSTSSSTSSPSSISVGLASSTIEGTSNNVASWSLIITPDTQEAASISQLATSITNLSTVQRTLVQALPKDKSLNYKVTSLTPKICQVSSARVRISKAGVCKVGFAIVDSAGNRYQIVKKLRRSF
jgi:hypothetical protein